MEFNGIEQLCKHVPDLNTPDGFVKVGSYADYRKRVHVFWSRLRNLKKVLPISTHGEMR